MQKTGTASLPAGWLGNGAGGRPERLILLALYCRGRNLLVYGPGRYHFRDFVKVGTPLTVICDRSTARALDLAGLKRRKFPLGCMYLLYVSRAVNLILDQPRLAD